MADVLVGNAWREAVLTRADRIDQELETLILDHDGARKEFAQTQIDTRIRHAREWATARHFSLAQLWSGSAVEGCWRELRLAEEAFSHIVPPEQLPRRARDAQRHADFYLATDDRLKGELGKALEAFESDGDGGGGKGPHSSKEEALRAAITSVLAAAHQASDQRHQDLRAFRNQLRVLAGVLFLLVGLVVAIAFGPFTGEFRLLPEPAGLGGGGAVLVAFGAGALGALFSAIPSLAQIPEKAVVFNPQREQALLKVAIGAWSGFVGLVTVKAGMTTDTAAAGSATTLAGFVIVAALFGAAQEAITRFADHKATELRDAAT